MTSDAPNQAAGWQPPRAPKQRARKRGTRTPGERTAGRRPQAAKRLFRGYGPLLGFAAVILATSILVPTVDQEIVTEQVAADDATARRAAGEAGEAAAADTETGQAAPGNQQPCADRAEQVPGDPYSPPCFAFEGDNGGTTTPGVTGTTINVSARILDGPSFQDALGEAAGAQISDTPEDIKRTMEGLAEYFNTRYQFYGRKMELAFYEGKGDSMDEILGGGQEAAEADAIRVADEIHAFAEINATTPPFADALSRRKIVNFGAPYMSREWLSQRAPYSWSPLTDCSIVVEAAGGWWVDRLAGGTAEYADGDLKGKPRTLGVIAPENSWYQECVAAGRKLIESAGYKATLDEKYKLALDLMSSQATNLIAKLKNAQVTSVLCGCDPVLLVFLTSKAREQDYHPEWLISGVAFVDQDLVGQLFDQSEWSRALGLSFAGQTQPLRASLGYNAYKSVRNDEPAFAVDLIYYQMQMLAIGIHMAGANLAPETLEAGMFAYPERTGPAGTWGFGPGDYTTTQDGREIYYDPDIRSVQNGEQGGYLEVEPGKRYRNGEWPTGELKVPR